MKKLLKILIIMLSIVLCSSCVISASAIESNENTRNITPYLNNYYNHVFSFDIINPGIAQVIVSYNGDPDVFVQAKVTVEIQKRNLLLFWKTIEIAEPNNKWIAYSNNVSDYFYGSFPIDGTGVYRAIIKFEVSGKNGTTDVVEDILEYEYK